VRKFDRKKRQRLRARNVEGLEGHAGVLKSQIDDITGPLIRYEKWLRGEHEDLRPYESHFFQDLVHFWIYWLMCMERKLWRELGPAGALEPIQNLRRLLEDLRNGKRSELTDQLFEVWKKARTQGDPVLVKEHKCAVANSYKLLRVATLCSGKQAERIVERCLKERGLKNMSRIPDLARGNNPFQSKRLISSFLRTFIFFLREAIEN
jgi:hypothetical protein